jgi:hypothetical protein
LVSYPPGCSQTASFSHQHAACPFKVSAARVLIVDVYSQLITASRVHLQQIARQRQQQIAARTCCLELSAGDAAWRPSYVGPQLSSCVAKSNEADTAGRGAPSGPMGLRQAGMGIYSASHHPHKAKAGSGSPGSSPCESSSTPGA